MDRNVLGSWMFGAVVLTLLVAVHWYAFRVEKSRSRRSFVGDVRGRERPRFEERVFTNEPLRPR